MKFDFYNRKSLIFYKNMKFLRMMRGKHAKRGKMSFLGRRGLRNLKDLSLDFGIVIANISFDKNFLRRH